MKDADDCDPSISQRKNAIIKNLLRETSAEEYALQPHSADFFYHFAKSVPSFFSRTLQLKFSKLIANSCMGWKASAGPYVHLSDPAWREPVTGSAGGIWSPQCNICIPPPPYTYTHKQITGRKYPPHTEAELGAGCIHMLHA